MLPKLNPDLLANNEAGQFKNILNKRLKLTRFVEHVVRFFV